MDPPESVTPGLPADADLSQPEGVTPINQQGSQSHSSGSLDQRQPRQQTDGLELLQSEEQLLHLEFQDSNLSPALFLMPVKAQHNFSEYSLLHQSETEFLPLRAYPDLSVESQKFHSSVQDQTTSSSEQGSLSQHPLAQATNITEEGASSWCSLSQHSLSLEEKVHIPAISSKKDRISKVMDPQRQTMFPSMPEEATQDETFFLSKNVSAEHLLDLLQKDAGLPSSSTSAVSPGSETSVRSTPSFTEESKTTETCRPSTDESMVEREGPPGEVSIPKQQTRQPDRVLNPNLSRDLPFEVSNITTGSRTSQPDESSEALRRELLSEIERRSGCEAQSVDKSQTVSVKPTTPNIKEMPGGKTNVNKRSVGRAPYTGPFSVGVERIQREQDLWSSGNQTGIDGSYLSILPQSQSTPGVLNPPAKSNVKAKLGHLSAIESNKERSYQSSSGISPQTAAPKTDAQPPDTANQGQKVAPSAEVQSLPALNYMEKVDAWRVNHNSGKTSLFDSLALQGFSGISPKKKAYDAVSETLNRLLSQQALSLQQPIVSSSANLRASQNSSAVPSGSASPRRGEAVGGAPSERDSSVPSAPPSASPCGRSQSHSSLSTVVMSVIKDQQTDGSEEQHKGQSEDHGHHHPSTIEHPSPFMSLGHFSDVSLDQDSTLSSSQDNYCGVKQGTSIGTSSVVSLEIDNYVPYWTSKLSAPPPVPRPRELNIDERIPLYLQNLGIDQSPSSILTPFAPRGPIREPEFSPTDLSTLKGSIGTPTQSIQASEGGSPHKGAFSRCSILSVDSSVSVPFSLDSLGPTVSVPEQRAGRTSPTYETYDLQSERRLASSLQSDEDSHSSFLKLSRPQQARSSTGSLTVKQEDELLSGVSRAIGVSCGETNLESLFQTNRSVSEAVEDSFVSTKALLEIRKLLSHAENMRSSESSAASTAPPAAPQPLPDEDLSLSLEKQPSSPQKASIQSSYTAREPKSHFSLGWTRSSSDSMLTSDQQRQSSVGEESATSSQQPDYPSTQATVTTSTTAPCKTPPDSNGAGTSAVLSESVRRTEPEGCSAAPPDKGPKQPSVSQPPPAVDTEPLPSTPPDSAEATEEEETTSAAPSQRSFSSPVVEDSEQEGISDGSSESSLAVRVAKLLQSESSATMVSSTPSTTDQEESKARDWLQMKISGQQREALELDKEDRKRIEEIKRELLLKNPMKSQESTDTESSVTSSVRFPKQQQQQHPQSAGFSDAKNQPTQPLQGLNIKPTDSNTQLQNSHCPDLETKVCEIAAREGLTLPTSKPRAFTSITITTCRRSTSPSPSTSPAPPHSSTPEPLLLTELSTETDKPTADNRQPPPPLDEEDLVTSAQTTNREASLDAINQEMTSQSAAGNPKRQDTVEGQTEGPLPHSHVIEKEDEAQSLKPANQAVESPARTGHVSHVRLNLSPKTTADHVFTTGGNSSQPTAALRPPQGRFVALRRSSSATSSPDEGVGLSSPPEWLDSREAARQRQPDRSHTSAMFKPVAQQRTTKTSTQSSTAGHRAEVKTRHFLTETPVPVLLPYKPRGSEELFYVPQTEVDVSSAEPSDTTMESSHTGSDDAVPPRFSSEVLGQQDPGLDRGVTIRHTEGIYSKRLKTATFKMQGAEHRESSLTANKSTSTSKRPSTQVSVAFTRVPSFSEQETLRRDQGTSPIPFLSPGHPQPRYPLVPEQPRRDSLEQLWQKFYDRWTAEESHPTRDTDTSRLERLERLFRLIHSTRSTGVSTVPEEGGHHPEEEKRGRRSEGVDLRTTKRESFVEVRRSKQEPPPIYLSYHRGEASQPEDHGSHTTSSFSSSGFSHSSSQEQQLYPADRDQSDSVSAASSSISTVDTERLIRVFGSHKVQHLKANSSLSKLYSAIDKQRKEREQRRERHRGPPTVTAASETTATSDSVVADSTSSNSTNTFASQRDASRTLTARKPVKLVNKGIQAGDLEIVRNGTRRHTRDVGTTFPSPSSDGALAPHLAFSSSVTRGRGGQRSLSKPPGVHKQRKSRRSPSKLYPAGVSWFISADGLSSKSRKENQPQPSASRPSTAWFQPYSRGQPWREPLRQRQVHQDRNEPVHPSEEDPPRRAKAAPSGLARVSLQESLEMRRPDFISRSLQRLKCLALQAQERKLQAEFSRGRHDFFYQHGGAERLPRPAGTALLRRAVPRKEMIHRSKQIYENLPEVTRRREEERRKAEYRSYRLNAQLYNKRITNRVLSRRSAWQ